MRLLNSISLLCLGLGASTAIGASWTFEDASLSVQSKGSSDVSKEKLSPNEVLSKQISLGPSDTLKVALTSTEGKTAKRPHQAFLTLHDPKSGLQDTFPFNIKESGKGKVEITQKDLPFQFLTSEAPVSASLILASFGSSTPYHSKAFSLHIKQDPNKPVTAPGAPLRYGSLPEIHHIFRDDPRSPPFVISGFFTLAVIATLPVLFGAWLYLGANVDHVGKALNRDPVSHVLFLGSVVAIEGVFFLYYTSWNLFQTLPAAGILGVIAFVSGSRALSEVQERRLAGQR